MVNATLKELARIIASRVASKARVAYTPYLQDVAEACVIAGWHARGRAERITKAERAVIEAAKNYAEKCNRNDSERTVALCHLTNTAALLDRARRKA